MFDAGRHQAQSAQAKAIYDEQVADYRSTVLTAYQEVEDNLAALRQLQQESISEAAAVTATAKAFAAGAVSLQGGIGHVSRGRDERKHLPAGAAIQCGHSTAPHERQRAVGEGPGRRLAEGRLETGGSRRRAPTHHRRRDEVNERAPPAQPMNCRRGL